MAGQRLALLIANANYQHTELRKLNAPQNDVQALQALLTRPEIGHYETQLLMEGTKGQMERAINRMLAKGEREDTALIFFAGHGIKHENGKLYFAAVDTEPDYLGGTAVSAAWLTEEMQNSRIGRQIILLDCCFGGAFARGNVWRGGDRVDRVESGKALEVPDLEVEDRGQVVVASADAMQFAFEGSLLKGEPSVSHFVQALKEGLETGDADRNPQDGKITIDELVSYLRKKMKELGSPQRPSKWIFGSVGGDLLFAYALKRGRSFRYRTVKQPVLVRLIFHPGSQPSRGLARHIYRQLNDDPLTLGLRVPTIFCPVTDRAQPPAEFRLDPTEHNFVVPLIDDRLTTDEEWSRFVGDIWERSQSSLTRLVPIQLSPNAWPVDARLREINFARAYVHPEGAVRTAFVVRQIVVELCRYLSNLETFGSESTAPVKLFLSHAKVDINSGKVIKKIIEALSKDQPILAWFQSGETPKSSKFSEAIEKGVKHVSLLVVLTDNYSTTEWCREELLLAKEKQLPIVVIDALTNKEIQSFPYLGNVPRIRWNDDPQAGIDLLLKETLRRLHATAILDQCKDPGDTVFTRPPELATLVGLDPNTSVLYPDPPIGASDTRQLAKTNVHFTTPLQRLAADKSLKGKLVALSVSESTDIDHFGLGELHLEDAMLDLSRYLLIKGAPLFYCGPLASEGYGQKLFELVRRHRDIEGVHSFERIVNHLGWPLPRLSAEKLAELNQVALTIELPRPADVNEALHPDFVERPTFFPGNKSAEHRFAWARGMTEMRAFVSERNRSGVVARVVLGGRFGPITIGRIPGVLEEVVLSVQAGQPVFLIGAFGGVPRLVIDLLNGKPREEATWDYQKRAPFSLEMRMLYEQRGLEWLDYPEMVDLLRQKSVVGINPLLSVNEHMELFETIDPSRMFEIVLQGLNRL